MLLPTVLDLGLGIEQTGEGNHSGSPQGVFISLRPLAPYPRVCVVTVSLSLLSQTYR